MATKKRGPRGDISTELLLDAAEAVLSASGRVGLSLRSIGRQAGVAPNAIYTYFADLDDLTMALADRFLATLDLPLLDDDPPEQALRAFVTATLTRFDSAPGHVALLASSRVAGPGAMGLNEALLRFFGRAGLDDDDAVAATEFVTEWVHGTAALSSSEAATPAFNRSLSRLDPTAWPLTASMLSRPSPARSVDLLLRAVLPATRQPLPD